jgi:hypothetical protein
VAAKDKYHEVVVRALRKANYNIEVEQYGLVYGKRRMWVDLLVSRDSFQIALLVEIKGFEAASSIDYFYSVVGQYVTYRAIIEEQLEPFPLYLAVPEAAMNGFLSEQVCQKVIERLKILFIVFDPLLEEVLYVTR